MNRPISAEERAALEVLNGTKVGILEAALVAKEALEAAHGRVSWAKESIRLGAKELRKREKTVRFETAVTVALEARKDRRTRTLIDFRYICRRLLKRCQGLAKRRIRSLSPQECAAYLHEAFTTPRQFTKAKAVLSAVFSTAQRHGWCAENPVRLVECPRLVEQRITVLTSAEIDQVLQAAAEYDHGSCLPAVGLMLYAGIRPHEVARLTWAQIDLENKAVIIEARHSKTGGARQVTIHPPLCHLLKQHQKPDSQFICPSGWTLRWRRLHRLLTFHWVPDVLRHTFATYHLKQFRSYTALQYETGHRSSTLLRTRYVNFSGLRNANLLFNVCSAGSGNKPEHFCNKSSPCYRWIKD